jgi:hypothetical protein
VEQLAIDNNWGGITKPPTNQVGTPPDKGLFEQFELPTPIEDPNAGNFFTPESPDASKPITDPGTTYFIGEGNVGADLLSGDEVANVDLFRHDIDNIYDRVQAYQRFGLLETPVPAFPPNQFNPKQAVMKVFSKELVCSVYLEKYELLTATNVDGTPLESVFGASQRVEGYRVYVDPKQYNSLIPAEARPPGSPDGVRPAFSGYLNSKFLDSGDSTYYPNHNFKINLANKAKSPEESQFEKSYVHFKSHYNFYESPYEEVIDGVDEKALPNLYTFMTVLSDKSSALSFAMADTVQGELGSPPQLLFSNKFWTHASLNNSIESLYAPQAEGTPLTKGSLLKRSPLSRYFDDWSEAAQTAGIGVDLNVGQPQMADPNLNVLQSVVQNYSRIFVPDLTNSGVLQYNKLARNFPMNVEFYFTTDPNNNFYEMLKATGHDALMLRWLSELASADSTRFVEFEGPEYRNFVSRLDYSFEEYMNAALTPIYGTTAGLPLDNTENLIYLGKAEYTGAGLMGMAPWIDYLSKAAALKQLAADFIKNKMLSYRRILNGTTCYNETFFYEVEKFSSSIAGAIGTKLQSFFFPNDKHKTINFIDTQVKYSTGYVYRIWKWQVVVGTDYSPSLIGTEEASAKFAHATGEGEIVHPLKNDTDVWFTTDHESRIIGDLHVKLTPNVRIIRVPYYNVVESNQEGVLPIHSPTVILDNPPLYPEIEFVPLIDERNNMIINIKDTIGSYKDYAKPINQTQEDEIYGDELLFEAILYHQLKNNLNLPPEELGKLNINTNKLLFKTDDLAQTFELYMLLKKPTTYSDFGDAHLDTVAGPNSAYKVKLGFNQKYYFTFRTTDIHQNFSNPTPVYEVEIIEESGMSYPVINVLDLEEENKKLGIQENVMNYTKNGKMFLCIKPNEEQTDLLSNLITPDEELDVESALDLMPISLGIKENGSAFGKKFKFRIKSKKTGRVFDVNFTPQNTTTETHISSEDGFGD